MSRIRRSWERFNRDAKETIGIGLLPFGVLAQCFKRNLGWKFLGVLLTLPMVALGCVTLAVTSLLAAAQLAFFVFIRFPSSLVEDIVTGQVEQATEDIGIEQEALLDNKTAVQWSLHNFGEDINQTLQSGWLAPLNVLRSFFNGGIPRALLGVVVALPMLAVTLVSGLIASMIAVAQTVLLPLRFFSAFVQDAISPELGTSVQFKDDTKKIEGIEPRWRPFYVPVDNSEGLAESRSLLEGATSTPPTFN